LEIGAHLKIRIPLIIIRTMAARIITIIMTQAAEVIMAGLMVDITVDSMAAGIIDFGPGKS
jgi:hypothetical protein